MQVYFTCGPLNTGFTVSRIGILVSKRCESFMGFKMKGIGIFKG